IHITTGFHPLWELVLIPLASLFGQAHRWAFARAAAALSTALAIGSAVIYGKLMERVVGPRIGTLAFVLIVGCAGITRFGLLGMEGPLALLLLSLTLMEATRSSPRVVVVGLLAGLTILARLDMLVPLGLALLAKLLLNKWDTRWMLAAVVAAAVT